MILLRKVVPRDFNLFLFGDDHEGTVFRHKEGWNQLIDMMSRSYGGLSAAHNFGVDHGDIVEAIMIDDPRYASDTVTAVPLQQVEAAIQNRLPIASKMVAILDGNHPRKLSRFGELTKHVCSKLGVPFGTYACRITYITEDGEILFKHFATHGTKSVNSAAEPYERARQNMKIALVRHLRGKATDCALLSKGHTHRLLVKPPTVRLELYDDGNKIRQRFSGAWRDDAMDLSGNSKWYVNTGSFQKLYCDMPISSYAEVAEYDPIELGFAVATVRDGRIVDIKKEFLD